MDVKTIVGGGMLARHKGKVAVGVAIAVGLGNYLTGATDLTGFAVGVLRALAGGM